MMHARAWALRCIHESDLHHENTFVTLTYDDDNLPCGEDWYTLDPRDLTLFWKRLRKELFDKRIRYFACGEYGDSTMRPHYHAIIFGHDFKDKELYSTSDGNNLYTSATLTRIWSHGHAVIGDVTAESAGYVARYTQKKQEGKNKLFYSQLGISPEYVVMSRRPGIGAGWYSKFHADVFPHDYLVAKDGHKFHPPKYYSRKFELEFPDEMKYIRNRREKLRRKRAHDNTPSRLEVKEKVLRAKVSRLSRPL